jgi:hypothetical protein
MKVMENMLRGRITQDQEAASFICAEETDLFSYGETDRFPNGFHTSTSAKGQT